MEKIKEKEKNYIFELLCSKKYEKLHEKIFDDLDAVSKDKYSICWHDQDCDLWRYVIEKTLNEFKVEVTRRIHNNNSVSSKDKIITCSIMKEVKENFK